MQIECGYRTGFRITRIGTEDLFELSTIMKIKMCALIQLIWLLLCHSLNVCSDMKK